MPLVVACVALITTVPALAVAAGAVSGGLTGGVPRFQIIAPAMIATAIRPTTNLRLCFMVGILDWQARRAGGRIGWCRLFRPCHRAGARSRLRAGLTIAALA